MTPEEHENYIGSDEFKKEVKMLIILSIILIIITIVVVIAKTPHYTPEQLECIRLNPMNKYLCGA